jgi:hypothetical protein
VTIEQSLYSTLTADGDVGPLLTNSDSPETFRLFAGVAPDNTAGTFAVYTMVFSNTPVWLNDIVDKENARFQLDLYADTYAEIRALADHCKDALNTSMLLTEFNMSAQYDADVKLHRMLIDFSVWE